MGIKPPEKCEGCPYAIRVFAGPAVGYNKGKQWSFVGCKHDPYKGKWIKEIKVCPIDEQREVTPWKE